MDYINFFSSVRDTVTAFAVSGGYLALFVILLSEGLPLIGIAVPGHIIVISGGFLAATGVLNMFWVFTISFVAVVLGDYISFMLGRKYGWPLIEKLRPFFFISKSIIDKTRIFLETHTGKALFIGRFNPVTRGLMPFFVGANRMTVRPFWIWNTAGAFAWVVSSIFVGYAVGLGFHVVSGWTGKALVVAIIVSVLTIWSYRFVNVRFHVFRRYELFILSLNIVSLIILFRLIEDASSAVPFTTNFDLYINGFVNDLLLRPFGSILINIASWVSAFGGTVMTSIFTLVGVIVFIIHKKWRSMSILLLSLISTAFSVGLLKVLILRIRPENLITIDFPTVIGFLFDHPSTLTEPSFPSGHAAFAAAFFVIVTYLAVPKIKSWVRRELLIVVSVLLVLAIGISRIIINAHWASDVVAGWALGIVCATISILLVRYLGTLIVKRIQIQ